MGKGTVLQDWMGELSWKQQSVLLTSLRGPDTSRPVNVKKVAKWLRKITQNDADPSTEFMNSTNLPTSEELNKELEYCTIHYVCHLMHSLEIIGYNHPNEPIRKIASDYYFGLVRALHLNPETKVQLNTRLEDKI